MACLGSLSSYDGCMIDTSASTGPSVMLVMLLVPSVAVSSTSSSIIISAAGVQCRTGACTGPLPVQQRVHATPTHIYVLVSLRAQRHRAAARGPSRRAHAHSAPRAVLRAQRGCTIYIWLCCAWTPTVKGLDPTMYPPLHLMMLMLLLVY